MKIKQFGDEILGHEPKFLIHTGLSVLASSPAPSADISITISWDVPERHVWSPQGLLPAHYTGAVMEGLLFDMFRKSYSKSESNS